MIVPAMKLLTQETPLESDNHFVSCSPPLVFRVVSLHCRLNTYNKWQSHLKAAERVGKDGTVNVRFMMGQAL